MRPRSVAAAHARISGQNSAAGGAGHPHSVVVMAIAASAIVLAGCGALVAYAGAATNRITEARETQMLRRAVDRNLARLREDVASAAIWNEAYDKTARGFDLAWADVNFGQYFHQYLGHDLTLGSARSTAPTSSPSTPIMDCTRSG